MCQYTHIKAVSHNLLLIPSNIHVLNVTNEPPIIDAENVAGFNVAVVKTRWSFRVVLTVYFFMSVITKLRCPINCDP